MDSSDGKKALEKGDLIRMMASAVSGGRGEKAQKIAEKLDQAEPKMGGSTSGATFK